MVLRGLLLAPIILVGSIVLLNACDRSLQPEVAAYARADSAPVPPEQNVFYPMLGFYAPADEDPHAFGQRAAKRYEEFVSRAATPDGFDLYQGVERSELKEWRNPRCRQHDESCLDAVLEGKDDVRKAISANKLLLARYESLHAYPAHANTLTPHLSSPIGSGSVTGGHSLWLAEQALKASEGSTGAALEAVGNDLRFWRRLAAQRANLLEKMVAIACISRDVRLLSDLLRQVDLTPTQQRAIVEMLAPLGPEERSLAGAFREEFRGHHLLFQNLTALENPDSEKAPDAAQRFFFQPNATSNRLYAMYRDYEALAALPASVYLAQEREVLARHQRENSFISWRSVYNPVGRILLGTAAPAQLFYVARVHDLDGLLRLVRLQAQIRMANVPPESVPEFIEQAGAAYADPYTGKPMLWQPEGRRLSFMAHGRASGESIHVQI